MTQPQKFQFKLFIENAEALSQEAVIPVFHDFIREKALPELLIDVADYRHVHEGPGVVLIGHGYDLYVDEMDGRPGLLFSRKREATGSVEEILRRSLAIALAAASLLEERLPIRFATNEVLFRAIDRLHTPNDDTTHEKLEPIVRKVLAELGTVKGVKRVGDPRAPYSLAVELEGAPKVKDASSKIAA